jgi:hypothetical protein
MAPAIELTITLKAYIPDFETYFFQEHNETPSLWGCAQIDSENILADSLQVGESIQAQDSLLQWLDKGIQKVSYKIVEIEVPTIEN